MLPARISLRCDPTAAMVSHGFRVNDEEVGTKHSRHARSKKPVKAVATDGDNKAHIRNEGVALGLLVHICRPFPQNLTQCLRGHVGPTLAVSQANRQRPTVARVGVLVGCEQQYVPPGRLGLSKFTNHITSTRRSARRPRQLPRIATRCAATHQMRGSGSISQSARSELLYMDSAI